VGWQQVKKKSNIVRKNGKPLAHKTPIETPLQHKKIPQGQTKIMEEEGNESQIMSRPK